MLVDTFKVVSPNVRYTEDAIESTYRYDSTRISRNDAGEFEVAPTSSTYEFAVDRRVPKLGCVGRMPGVLGLSWDDA
jgi:myo-inositol-1-phosphate synthase